MAAELVRAGKPQLGPKRCRVQREQRRLSPWSREESGAQRGWGGQQGASGSRGQPRRPVGVQVAVPRAPEQLARTLEGSGSPELVICKARSQLCTARPAECREVSQLGPSAHCQFTRHCCALTGRSMLQSVLQHPGSRTRLLCLRICHPVCPPEAAAQLKLSSDACRPSRAARKPTSTGGQACGERGRRRRFNSMLLAGSPCTLHLLPSASAPHGHFIHKLDNEESCDHKTAAYAARESREQHSWVAKKNKVGMRSKAGNGSQGAYSGS